MNTTTTPDLAAVKVKQQATWASGDFAEIATLIVPVAEQLADAADLRAGSTVLDVATGSGNAAIAAARLGCRVTGIDYVPSLLERGRERAAAERVAIEFRDGDAEEIPFPDGSFDAALSVFGSMFAPDQPRAAGELARVTRPGGTIALASWTPDGFIGEMFKTVGAHVPPPPGLASPLLWGTEDHLGQLFGVGRRVDARAAHVHVPLHLGAGVRGHLRRVLRPDREGARGRGRRPRRSCERPARSGGRVEPARAARRGRDPRRLPGVGRHAPLRPVPDQSEGPPLGGPSSFR